MPQRGWIINGERMTHAEAMAYAWGYPANFDYTPQDLEEMYQDHLRTYISPTMFSGCARQEVLKRTVDYWLDPDKVWALRRGTLAHKLMEDGTHEPDAILEQKLACEVLLPDGRTLTLRGTPDKVVPSKKLLIDYKTIKQLTGVAKGHWIAQLSCYRWMLWQHGIEVERAFIQQIGMERPKRLYIPLHPLAWAEQYIIRRAPQFVGVVDGTFDLDHLPPLLNFTLDTDATWQCYARKGPGSAWCPVADQCMRLWQEEGR